VANVTDAPPVLKKLQKAETLRTYHYPGGMVASFSDVTAIYVSERSGNHRLEFNGGKRAIVLAGFKYITISGGEWEF
jgi:hypothetical protein